MSPLRDSDLYKCFEQLGCRPDGALAYTNASSYCDVAPMGLIRLWAVTYENG